MIHILESSHSYAVVSCPTTSRTQSQVFLKFAVLASSKAEFFFDRQTQVTSDYIKDNCF